MKSTNGIMYEKYITCIINQFYRNNKKYLVNIYYHGFNERFQKCALRLFYCQSRFQGWKQEGRTSCKCRSHPLDVYSPQSHQSEHQCPENAYRIQDKSVSSHRHEIHVNR